MQADEVEAVVETAELVAEVVEKVAKEVDKLADEVVDVLPPGGRLRNAVAAVDKVAEMTVKGADLVEDFIHKVPFFVFRSRNSLLTTP